MSDKYTTQEAPNHQHIVIDGDYVYTWTVENYFEGSLSEFNGIFAYPLVNDGQLHEIGDYKEEHYLYPGSDEGLIVVDISIDEDINLANHLVKVVKKKKIRLFITTIQCITTF